MGRVGRGEDVQRVRMVEKDSLKFAEDGPGALLVNRFCRRLRKET